MKPASLRRWGSGVLLSVNLVAAMAAYAVVWLVSVGAALALFGPDLEDLWLLCALVVGGIGLWRMVGALRGPKAVWLVGLRWLLLTLVAPVALPVLAAPRVLGWLRRVRLPAADRTGPRRVSVLVSGLALHIGVLLAWALWYAFLVLMLGAWENSVDATDEDATWSSEMLEKLFLVAGALWLVGMIMVVWAWWAYRRSATLIIPVGWLAVAGMGALVAVFAIADAEGSGAPAVIRYRIDTEPGRMASYPRGREPSRHPSPPSLRPGTRRSLRSRR